MFKLSVSSLLAGFGRSRSQTAQPVRAPATGLLARLSLLLIALATMMLPSVALAQTAPVITSVSPNRGSYSESAPLYVSLSGTGLQTATGVTFGGVASTTIFWSDHGQILGALLPPGSGVVDVVATGPSGSSAASPAARFTYVGRPVIHSVTVSTGGRGVTIRGENLFGVLDVSRGAESASVIVDRNNGDDAAGTEVSASWATAGSGQVAITVITGAGSATAVADFSPRPTLGGTSPSTGPTAGGTSVTLSGAHFIDGFTSIQIGGVTVPASGVRVDSTTSLTFTTPAHAAGNQAVTVTTPDGTSDPLPGGFTYQSANLPVITSLSRNTGSYAPDAAQILFIYGAGLQNATRVTFGGVSGNDVFWSEYGQFLAVSIPENTGTVDVIVTTPDGSSVPNAATRFTYMVAPVITSVTVDPEQQRVTIHGRGLADILAVTVGSADAVAFSRNNDASTDGTTAWAMWSSDAVSGDGVSVTIATLIGTASGWGPWPSYPVAMSPAEGPVEGGTLVTITGEAFVPLQTSVTIGGISLSGSAVAVNGGSLTFVTPPHAAGNVEVTVRRSNGVSATAPGGFTYRTANAPVVTSVNASQGAYRPNDFLYISIAGDHLENATAVTFGGVPSTAVMWLANGGKLLVLVPENTGTVDVLVTTPNGTSAPNANSRFTYLEAPEITSVEVHPSGSSVQVNGRNLFNILGVGFANGDATTFNASADGTSITATAPATGSLGNPVAVRVLTSFGEFTGYGTFNPPSATALSAAAGPVAGGTSVTVTGTGFVEGYTSVTMGNVEVPASSVTVTSAASLSFTTPAHAAGTVAVTVTTRAGTSSPVPGGFTYQASAALPVVTGLTPNRGGTDESTPLYIVISGSNLETATGVTFGGVNATTFGASTVDQTLLVGVPPGSGVVDVLVTTPAGTSAPNPNARFTYIGPPEITSVTVNPSQMGVTIHGRNLLNIMSITLGGAEATFFSRNTDGSDGTVATASWSPSTTPGNPTSVAVMTAIGTAYGSGVWQTVPSIGGLSPSSGPVAGSTTVTVSGADFVPGASSVTIGGVEIPAASVAVNGPTSLTFTTPAHAAGNVEVTVRTPGGTSGAAPGGFTYQPAAPLPVVTSLGSRRGFVDEGTFVQLLIYGTDIQNATGVTFGGVPSASVIWSDAGQFLVALVPPGTGTVEVQVVTPGGTSAPNPDARFTYLGNPVISSVTVLPNGVEIHGQNLFGVTSVMIDGHEASDVFDRNTDDASTGTLVRAAWSPETPPSSSTVNVVVYAVGGAASGTGEAAAFPTLTAISPAAGSTDGGATVTLTGTNFVAGSTSVMIGAHVIPAAGVTVNSATSLSFTTPANAAGTVGVTVTTPSGTSGAVAGGFTYQAAAAPPIAGPVAAQVAYGSADNAIPLALTGGAATAVAISAPPTHGVATVTGTAIAYTPNPGYGGADSFAYTATNADGTSAPATVTITVTPPTLSLDATALPDARTGAAYSQTRAVSGGTGPYVYSVPVGTLPDGLQINPATGAISGSPTTPGTYAFTLRATDASTGTSPYAVDQAFSITVAAATPPVVGPVAVTVEYGSAANPIPLNLSGGAAASLTIATSATHGVATVSGTVITYTPNSTYSGPDSFTYTATNADGTSAPATVTVTVLPAPVAPPIAGPVSVTVARDSSQNPIPLNLSGGAVSGVAVIGQPLHGMAAAFGTSIDYTPAPGYSGADSFTYVAVNGAGTSTPATVTVTVAAAPPPPPPPPGPPSPDPVSVGVPFGSTGVVITPTFATGTVTALAIATPPGHGTVSVSGLGFTYVPNATYQGQDGFTFVAEGPGGVSAPVAVTLTVEAPQPPTVDAPAGPMIVPTPPAGTSTFSIDLSALIQGPIDGFRITGAAGNGTAEIVSGSAVSSATSKSDGRLGAVGGYRLVYRPSATFLGTDTLTLVAVGPGGESRPLTFVFQVAGKAPALSGQVAAGEVLELVPTTGLTGGPFQAVRITRAPDVGTAVVRGQTIVFTAGPAAGATWLEYVIDLPFGTSAVGRIDLVAHSVPQSQRLVATTRQGQPVSVVISDAAGGPFIGAAVVSVSPAPAGNAVIAVSGTDRVLTFTPSGSFAGEATVTYSLTNAFATRDGILEVTVEPRPDPALDPDVRGIASAQASAARRTADAQVGNFRSRLQDLRNGRNGSSNSLRLNLGTGLDAQNDPRQTLARQLGRSTDGLAPGEEDRRREWERLQQDRWADHAPDAAVDTLSVAQTMGSTASPAREPLFGAWAAGSVDLGRQDASGQRDTRITTQGVSGGLDARLSDSLILGAGAGYGEDRARIGDAGTTAETQAVTAAVYGSWRPLPRVYLDGVAGYASLDIDTRRMTGPAGDPLAMRAEGTRSGDMRFASVALGRDFDRRGMSGDIYLRLDARETDLDAFTETGAASSNLTWNALRQDSLSAGFGGSIRWRLETRRHGLIEPSLGLEWTRELEDIGVQDVRYSDWLSSPDYPIVLDGWSRQSLRLNLGLGWSLTDRLSLDLSYRGMLGDASSSHGGQIGLTYGW